MLAKFFVSSLLSLFVCLFSAQSFALCVNVSKANLRFGPSTKQQKTWEVYKYMPFEKLKEQGGWYRVKDVDGDIHWIAKQLVTKAYKCAVVKVKKANLRTSPTTSAAKVPWGPAKKYWAFKVIGTKGKWVNIEEPEGSKAWVHKDLLWIQ